LYWVKGGKRELDAATPGREDSQQETANEATPMNSTFTIAANDQPLYLAKRNCARCGEPLDPRGRLIIAIWNELEFRYCEKCAGKAEV